MSVINKWDYAPDEATHYAVDRSGLGFWHAGEPYFDGTIWGGATLLKDDREYRRAVAAHSLESRPAKRPPLNPVAVHKVDDTPQERT